MKKTDKIITLLSQLEQEELDQIKYYLKSQLSFSNQSHKNQNQNLTTQELDYLSSVFRH
ncbi:hypothetical protein R3X26_03225 [Vibrio sp. TH_r3]|uniref:hypothetical protein n=1 Tax=Vibrio sp. TH_r3 TaxID=3082084 RepID=UPI0029542411|nr:hypothetical protein [Vibrio sp. TH_r3]MDV7103413.1 hypothetical protein [Vibrio sp. TH_r3]